MTRALAWGVLLLAIAGAPRVHAAAVPPAPAGVRANPDRSGQYRTDQGLVEPSGVRMRVRVTPSPARLGQVLRYEGYVLLPPGSRVRFEPPSDSTSLAWSGLRAGRSRGTHDSVWVRADLQVFATGPVAIPGLGVQLDPFPLTTRPGHTHLPTTHLMIVPTLTDADSSAELRALHGPLRAPWWERLPWLALVVAALLALAVVLVLRALRRRKPKPVPRPAAAPVVMRPRLDPASEALRALAALRARELPEAQRFGEHALELTAILRRFLEATLTTPRPGDTSGEVLERLRAARLPDADLERLEGLLGLWDRVKFAREPLTAAEAVRCEDAVESYVRSVAQSRLEAESAARAAARAAAQAAASGASASAPAPAAGSGRGGPPTEAA